jgi:hypothetical protein
MAVSQIEEIKTMEPSQGSLQIFYIETAALGLSTCRRCSADRIKLEEQPMKRWQMSMICDAV